MRQSEIITAYSTWISGELIHGKLEWLESSNKHPEIGFIWQEKCVYMHRGIIKYNTYFLNVRLIRQVDNMLENQP